MHEYTACHFVAITIAILSFAQEALVEVGFELNPGLSFALRLVGLVFWVCPAVGPT